VKLFTWAEVTPTVLGLPSMEGDVGSGQLVQANIEHRLPPFAVVGGALSDAGINWVLVITYPDPAAYEETGSGCVGVQRY